MGAVKVGTSLRRVIRVAMGFVHPTKQATAREGFGRGREAGYHVERSHVPVGISSAAFYHYTHARR